MTKRQNIGGESEAGKRGEARRQRSALGVGRAASLHERLSEIAKEIARAPRTGKKADKKFFDNLSAH
jgi:hypothetical protein